MPLAFFVWMPVGFFKKKNALFIGIEGRTGVTEDYSRQMAFLSGMPGLIPKRTEKNQKRCWVWVSGIRVQPKPIELFAFYALCFYALCILCLQSQTLVCKCGVLCERIDAAVLLCGSPFRPAWFNYFFCIASKELWVECTGIWPLYPCPVCEAIRMRVVDLACSRLPFPLPAVVAQRMETELKVRQFPSLNLPWAHLVALEKSFPFSFSPPYLQHGKDNNIHLKPWFSNV